MPTANKSTPSTRETRPMVYQPQPLPGHNAVNSTIGNEEARQQRLTNHRYHTAAFAMNQPGGEGKASGGISPAPKAPLCQQ